MIISRPTRFRAYQLGTDGSSFSYFADGVFTLVEARLNDVNEPSIRREMEVCGVTRMDKLHITSWDNDHCAPNELARILEAFSPRKIETPGYKPISNSGIASQEAIRDYRSARDLVRQPVTIRPITPSYIETLNSAENLTMRDIFYHPRWLDQNCMNNNSTVKLFRSGIFNVLSLGDVENPAISSALRRQRILREETDVVILAHHGADNGFTTKSFLQALDPSVAVCSSSYANQYDHPRQEVRNLLWEQRINLFTTKTGDVIITSLQDTNGRHSGRYRVINLIAGSTEVSRELEFVSKKAKLLSYNTDTLRQRYAPRPHHPRR